MLTIVSKGNLERIGDIYLPVVDAILKHGRAFPDYLTDKQILLADSAPQYFDLLAERVESQGNH